MFCRKNQLTAAYINERSNFRLGLIIESLRCHHDSLLKEIGNTKENRELLQQLKRGLHKMTPPTR